MLTSFSILCAIRVRKTFFCSQQMENPVAEYFWMLSQAFFSPFLVPLLFYISFRLKQALHRFGGFLISQCVWKIRVTWEIQNIQYEAMSSAMKIWKPMPSYGLSTLIWFKKLPVASIFQLFLQMHSYHDSKEKTKENEYISNYFLFCFSWDVLLFTCILPSLLYD